MSRPGLQAALLLWSLAGCKDSDRQSTFNPTTLDTVLVAGRGNAWHSGADVFKVQIQVPRGYIRHPQSTVDPEWSLGAKYESPILELRILPPFDRRHASKCSFWREPFRWVDMVDGVMESCERIPARRIVFSGELALECIFKSEVTLPKERVAEAWKICESIVVTPCKSLGFEQDERPYSLFMRASCNDGLPVDERDFRRYVHRHSEKVEKERKKTM